MALSDNSHDFWNYGNDEGQLSAMALEQRRVQGNPQKHFPIYCKLLREIVRGIDEAIK